MKKSTTLQILAILIFVGILIFLFQGSKKPANTGNLQNGAVDSSYSTVVGTGKDSLYEVEQKQLQAKMDSYALYNAAVDAVDISACDKITENPTLKMECSDNVYAALASKDTDASLCKKITDESTRNRCTNSFFYNGAIASGKESDCKKITSDETLTSACMKNIVFTKIENPTFSGTTDACSDLTGPDKDYCMNRIGKDADIDLLQKGTNTKDPSICGKIKDVNMKNTCNDTVYTTLALERKDSSICTKIVDISRKTTCSTQFARVNDATILSKALSENNLPLCSTITTSELKIKCSDTLLLQSGVAAKDATMCSKIVDTSTKKQCNDAVKVMLDQLSKQK